MKLGFIEKFGSLGTLLVVAACPGCWPLFIPLGTTLGLRALLPFEGIMMNYVFPPFVLITLFGSYMAFRVHQTYYPLIISVVRAVLIFIGFYAGWLLSLLYVGLFGLLVGSVACISAKKQCQIRSVD